ncbi:hypothetical protein SAMN05446037_1011130 [Anaerovirgula multivorans]|uniref:Uncharacterized protein n=1 Tax=Anaerovirgula multivorans TaxID=312168 RepID=A0A239F0Q1_9FIRM|nr:hypothetical protein [Anaerovirgula multivorans]SNS50415.1 hypothetical protein SAMN05446037_1011130 [Anaerovirgula multivorans]
MDLESVILWLMGFLLFAFKLIYNIPIVMFFWLHYDNNRILTIKKAEKIKQINNGFLIFNVVSYVPYFYMYYLLTIIYDRLPPLWITIIPIICSWVNIKLSNNFLKKATEDIKPKEVK